MISKLFFELMKNESYRTQFVDRYAELLQTHLSPKRCFHIIDSIAELVEPELALHIDRWGHPTSIFDWKQDLDNMRDFINARSKTVGSELEKHFNIDAGKMNEVEQVFFISQDQKIIGASSLVLILIVLVVIIRRRKKKQTRRSRETNLSS